MELRRNCEGTFACLQVRYVIYRNQIFIVINNCRCRGNTIYSLSFSLALSFSFASPRFVSALSTERKSRLSGDIPSAQFGSRSSHTNSIFLNGHAGVFLGMAVLVYGRPVLRNGSCLCSRGRGKKKEQKPADEQRSNDAIGGATRPGAAWNTTLNDDLSADRQPPRAT